MQEREYGPHSGGKPTRQDGSVSGPSVTDIDPQQTSDLPTPSCSLRAHDWSLPCTNQSWCVPTRCSNETGHPHCRARNGFRQLPPVAGLEPTRRQTTPRGCPVFRVNIGPGDETTWVASAG